MELSGFNGGVHQENRESGSIEQRIALPGDKPRTMFTFIEIGAIFCLNQEGGLRDLRKVSKSSHGDFAIGQR